jgi:mono/diheme cytochrome c family protein
MHFRLNFLWPVLCAVGLAVVLGGSWLVAEGDDGDDAVKAEARLVLDDAAMERGRAVHEKLCAACHSTDGTTGVGMTFRKVWGTQVEQADGSKRLYNREFFIESLFRPDATLTKGFPNQMPPFILSQRQVYDLAEFVRSMGDPALVLAADADEPKIEKAGAPGAVQLFVLCNDLDAMDQFYGSALALGSMMTAYEDEERLSVYRIAGVELTVVKAESPVDVPTGWAWTPDHPAEGEHGLSLSLDMSWRRFQNMVMLLPFLEVRTRTETPVWRESGRWAWTVADPMGNTVTLTSVPPKPPENADDPKWPG